MIEVNEFEIATVDGGGEFCIGLNPAFDLLYVFTGTCVGLRITWS